MSGYVFEKHAKYCHLQFTSELAEMEWPAIEAAASEVSQLAKDAPSDSVLADLSSLESMPEGFVALLVRLWRELDAGERKFVVVAPQENIQTELKQAGLSSLWDVTDSVNAAHKSLGVPQEQSSAAPAEPPAPAPTKEPATTTKSPAAELAPSAQMDSGTDPFVFEDQRGYCSVQFNPILMSMGWAEVEAGTTAVIDKLKKSTNNSVMVDLGPMKIINSGLVASLVRIWKTMQERNGQFSLASPNEMVTDVLKSAGLWKLWTVVDDREEAVYTLGAGEVAQVEQRERRLLSLVAVPCALIAVLALSIMYANRGQPSAVNSHLAALLLASAALTTGLLSIFKDNGLRRILSCVAVLTAIGVLSSLWFDKNPIVIGSPAEARPQKKTPGSTKSEAGDSRSNEAASDDDDAKVDDTDGQHDAKSGENDANVPTTKSDNGSTDEDSTEKDDEKDSPPENEEGG